MADIKTTLNNALDAGKGVLRLFPTWVPRTFCVPGKRMKLHPDDLYAFGAHRGGIEVKRRHRGRSATATGSSLGISRCSELPCREMRQDGAPRASATSSPKALMRDSRTPS